MKPAHPDEPLVRRFVAGEIAACRTIERWAREFVRFRAFGISGDDADDLVQQSVALLWSLCSRSGFELRFGLRALLRRIAYARCVDWIRRRRPRAELDEALPAGGEAPESELILREDWARVREAVQRLGPLCREILQLHFLEERSYAELARTLNRPEGTLRSRVFECIRAVRRTLAAAGTLWAATLIALAPGPARAQGAPAARPAEQATRLDASGNEAYRSGRFHESLALYEQALAVRSSLLPAKHADLGTSHQHVGDMLARLDRFREARAHAESAVVIRTAALGTDDPAVAISLNLLAMTTLETSGAHAALPHAERALAILERRLGPRHPFVAAVQHNLGTLASIDGDPKRSLTLARESVLSLGRAAIPEFEDPVQAFALLQRIPTGGADEMLVERMRALWGQTLGPDCPRLIPRMSDDTEMQQSAPSLSWWALFAQRLFPIAERALPPGHPDLFFPLLISGRLYESSGDFANARHQYERALELATRTLGPTHTYVGVAHGVLGYLALEIDDPTEARRHLEASLAVCEKGTRADVGGTWGSLNDLALLAMREGRDREAESLLLHASRELAKGVAVPHLSEAIPLDNLCLLYARTGRDEEARVACERALAIREAYPFPDLPDKSFALGGLGALAERAGRLEESSALAVRAADLLRRTLGPAHPRTIWFRLREARLLAAAGHADSAFAIALEADSISRSQFRNTLGALSERQAFRFSEARTSGVSLLLTLLAEGRAAEPANVAAAWDAVVRSRALTLDEVAERYRLLSQVGDSSAAALVDEFVRAREQLARAAVQVADAGSRRGPMPPLDVLRQRAEETERSLARRSAAFRAERDRDRSGLREVARSLGPGAALVSFVRFDGSAQPPGRPRAEYAAFVLPPGPGARPSFVRLGDAHAVDRAARAWVLAIAGGRDETPWDAATREAACRRAGARVRELVWDPIQRLVGGAGLVLIVPDGELHRIPWVALPDGDGYLVERGPLVHLLTAERDALAPGRTVRASGLLAAGGPSFDSRRALADAATPASATQLVAAARFRGPGVSCDEFRRHRFAPLPGSAAEASWLARSWRERRIAPSDADTAILLVGGAATEAAVKRLAEGRRIVHLSTHGFFLGAGCLADGGGAPPAGWSGADAAFSLSGLALAGANRRADAGLDEDDGVLTAEEVATLDLRGAEWVVLSSCESAAGEDTPWEGVSGLQRAFRLAGARATIMSLWSVDDQAVREWMEALYRGRFQRGLDTAASVREAQRSVLAARRRAGRSAHPFHWAAFVATGDWR